jgi:UDP-N-acetylmuramate dehydrogenase
MPSPCSPRHDRDRRRGGTIVSATGVSARLSDAEAQALGTDIQRRLGIKTSRREPLARFSTMRVGGPADLFATIYNLFELRGLIRFARGRDLPFMLIGRGSDLVISDAGVGGLVVVVRAQGARFEGPELVAEAGLPMAKAATMAKDAGLSGLEFGLAIPGTVGGAVWANAGAHDADIAGRLVEASIVEPDGSEAVVPAAELALTYRDSALKAAPPDAPRIATWARFRLEAAEPAVIAERLDAIRRWRQAHQPLGQPSAGSVFRNPADGPSAGAIIDGLGLKGRRVGGAVVSEKHANFIVNDRHGTAGDVRRLAEEVQAIVREQAGVELRFEVVFAGDWAAWPEAA